MYVELKVTPEFDDVMDHLIPIGWKSWKSSEYSGFAPYEVHIHPFIFTMSMLLSVWKSFNPADFINFHWTDKLTN